MILVNQKKSKGKELEVQTQNSEREETRAKILSNASISPWSDGSFSVSFCSVRKEMKAWISVANGGEGASSGMT